MISKNSPKSTQKSISSLIKKPSTPGKRSPMKPSSSYSSSSARTGTPLPNINGLEYPSVIRFERWQVGHEMVKKIVLKNMGSRTEKITYNLPTHKFFVIEYPKIITLSSGMTATITVKFRPTEAVYHSDSVNFQCRNGKFAVQLEAILPQHMLTCIKELNFGACPTAIDNKHSFSLKNSGDCVTKFNWECQEPFSVQPAHGTLKPGETTEITVIFNSRLALNITGIVACHYGEYADTEKVEIKVSAHSQYPLLRASDYIIQFGQNCYPRKTKSIPITLKNDGHVKAQYEIHPVFQVPNPAFHLSKHKGIVLPKSHTQIMIKFTPTVRDFSYLTIFRVSCTGGHDFDIECRGDSQKPPIEIKPSILNFGHVQTGSEISKSLVFRNNANADTLILIKTPASSKFDYSCNMALIVPADYSLSVPVVFKSDISGHFYQNVEIWTQEANPMNVNLVGTCSVDSREIPDGRHEILMQHFRNSSGGSNQSGSTSSIIVDQSVVQMCSNSCKTIKITNDSTVEQRISFRQYPKEDINMTVNIIDRNLAPGKSTKLNIECFSSQLTTRTLFVTVESHPSHNDPERPTFMKINAVPIEILVDVADELAVSIAENFRKMAMRPVLEGQATFLTFPVNNNGPDASILEWIQLPSMSILPAKSVIPANSSKLCVVYVKSEGSGTQAHSMKANLISANQVNEPVEMGEAKLDTVVPSMEMISPVDLKLALLPSCIRMNSESHIEFYNKSPIEMTYSLAVENTEKLKVFPSEGVLSPYSIAKINVTYQSEHAEIFSAKVNLKYSFPNQSEKQVSIEVFGKSIMPDLECIPSNIDLGQNLVNSSVPSAIILKNNCEADVPCIIAVVNDSDTSHVLQRESVLLPAQTSTRYYLKLQLNEIAVNKFSIIATPIDKTGKEYSKEQKTLCNISLVGSRAMCQIDDVFCAGLSKGDLWKNLSVSRFNHIFGGINKPATSKEDEIPFTIMNFGQVVFGIENAIVIKLRLKNNGVVPADWMVYSVLDGSVSGEQSSSLISIVPNSSHLEPEESCITTLTFSPKSTGYKRAAMIFELSQGYNAPSTRCQIWFHALVVPPITTSKAYQAYNDPLPVIAFPFYKNCSSSLVQKISCPRPLFMPNLGQFKLVLPENSKMQVIESSLKITTEKIEFRILPNIQQIQKDEVWSEILTLQNGPLSCPIELFLSSKAITSQMVKSRAHCAQEFNTMKLASQSILLTKECVDFGLVPLESNQRSLITFRNNSKTQNVSVSWIIPDNEYASITIEPSNVQSVSTGSSVNFEVVLQTTKTAENLHLDLICVVEDFSSSTSKNTYSSYVVNNPVRLGVADRFKGGIMGSTDRLKGGVMGSTDRLKGGGGVIGSTDKLKKGGAGSNDKLKERAKSAGMGSTDKLKPSNTMGSRDNLRTPKNMRQLHVSVLADVIPLGDYYKSGGDGLKLTITTNNDEPYVDAISELYDPGKEEKNREMVDAIATVLDSLILNVMKDIKLTMDLTPRISTFAQMLGMYSEKQYISQKELNNHNVNLSIAERMALQQVMEALISESLQHD